MLRCLKIEIDEAALMESIFPHAEAAPELWELAGQGVIPARSDRRELVRKDAQSLIRKARDHDLVYVRISFGHGEAVA